MIEFLFTRRFARQSRFCPVCRYVLVAQIDPVQHALVGSEHAKHFAL